MRCRHSHKKSMISEQILVSFDLPLKLSETPFLRGAFIGVNRDNVYAHNHLPDGKVRFSYPLVQYKVLNGHGALLCVSQADKDAPLLALPPDGPIRLGRRQAQIVHLQTFRAECELGILERPVLYTVRDYLPFNQENHEAYLREKSIVRKIALLERCIVGNILSLYKGLGVRLEERIAVKIHDILTERPESFKGVNMLCFDVVISANVAIPALAGIGKGVSLGFGTVDSQV